MRQKTLLPWLALGLVFFSGCLFQPNTRAVIDSHKEVEVYYNGSFRKTHGRHLGADGYNYGLKWQCVEFAKRYYAEALDHRMPETYGHAKDFFDSSLKEGTLNTQRNLFQFPNGSQTPPRADDLLVWEGGFWNEFGHIAVITHVAEGKVHMIQQNKGSSSRDALSLQQTEGHWYIEGSRIKGWLGKRD